MVGKPNLNPEHNPSTRTHGSSLYSQPTALDQERAASMADEGGVSGAITDALEQEEPFEQSPSIAPRRSVGRWMPWLTVGLGVWLFMKRQRALH